MVKYESTMDDPAKLDVYTTWLDLDPGPRPPNHYQLLQIEPFCGDQERIHEAVQMQICRVKPFEDHPDETLRGRAQDLMNEIARAWVVLRDSRKKGQYDRELSGRMGISTAVDTSAANDEVISLSSVTLTVEEAPGDAGQTYQLSSGGDSWLGSEANCTVRLVDARVPRRAARVFCRKSRWYIERGPDAPQVQVNDLPCSKAVLNTDDRLRFGPFLLRVEVV